jgi:hypothetical protein
MRAVWVFSIYTKMEKPKNTPHHLWQYEKAIYELPQSVMLTKAAGLWVVILPEIPSPFYVWQDSKETFLAFVNRANNEIRARKV